ncbi:MAG: cobalamin biosynthesis protein [Candidatus Bathyarchaeia archaeon]
MDFSSLVDHLMILFLAVVLDIIFGEPPNRIHPTVWMGKIIFFLKKKIKGKGAITERINGALIAFFVIAFFSLPIYFMLLYVRIYFGQIAYIILGALILKPTFAIKCMKQYTLPIAKFIKTGNIEQARCLLPYIVRRDPTRLDSQHIISAAIESIAESTVDGITSPFFYFTLLDVPGAVAFRAINTLDSMVGYKDPEHINIGWFSAKLDSLANYVPARLTALLMVLAAWFLNEDWKSAWRTLQRDKNKTESINAGWPMSAMAGALTVQLEKPGHYILGEGKSVLSPESIYRALHIMELTTLLFITLVTIPLKFLLMLL